MPNAPTATRPGGGGAPKVLVFPRVSYLHLIRERANALQPITPSYRCARCTNTVTSEDAVCIQCIGAA